MRLVSKKVDPRNYDYNGDNEVTESDWDIGKKDLNKDGKVTDAEEKKYDKERSTTTSETKYDSEGRPIRTETSMPAPEEEAPKWSRDKAAAAGYTREFLSRHPAVANLLKKAIEFNWTEAEFADRVRRDTKWGQNTTKSQRQFDLEYYGVDSKTIKSQVAVNSDNIMRLAENAGISITKEEADKFAYRFTRSGLSQSDVYSFLARQYGKDVSPEGAAEGTETGSAVPTIGTSREIYDELAALARAYGVTITPETLNKKVQEGIAQGPEWRTWIEGQRNFFRESAKNMYSDVADKLDQYTLEELVDPYLEEASALLGIRRENMDITNPMWTAALKGADGKPMNRDEWLRTLRTDKQYGWNQTQRAKTEMAQLGDELLAAFGMA